MPNMLDFFLATAGIILFCGIMVFVLTPPIAFLFGKYAIKGIAEARMEDSKPKGVRNEQEDQEEAFDGGPPSP